MTRRVPFGFNQNPQTDIQQSTIILDIHITVDGKGLMKTTVAGNPPPNVVQVVTALVDSLKGYMDNVNKQASMIIDPNKGQPVNGEELNVGKETQNNHNG